MTGPTDEELEEVVRKVRQIRRQNTMARVSGVAVASVFFGAAILERIYVGFPYVMHAIAGVGLFAGGAVWRALESNVHPDDL